MQWNASHCPTREWNRAHGLHLSPDCLESVRYSTSSLESFVMSFSFTMVDHYQRWPWPSSAVTSSWLETIHLLVSHVWTLSLHVWRGVHHPPPLTGLVALPLEWLQVCPKEPPHFLRWRLGCSRITDLQEYKWDSGVFDKSAWKPQNRSRLRVELPSWLRIFHAHWMCKMRIFQI